MWVYFEKLDLMCFMGIVFEMNVEFFSLFFEFFNVGNCLELGIIFVLFKLYFSEGFN